MTCSPEAGGKSRIWNDPTSAKNRDFHRQLAWGVSVEAPDSDGSIRGHLVRLVDFQDQEANDWLAVNQFTVIERQANRRSDIVIFLNGLPLAVIELKKAGACLLEVERSSGAGSSTLLWSMGPKQLRAIGVNS